MGLHGSEVLSGLMVTGSKSLRTASSSFKAGLVGERPPPQSSVSAVSKGWTESDLQQKFFCCEIIYTLKEKDGLQTHTFLS